MMVPVQGQETTGDRSEVWVWLAVGTALIAMAFSVIALLVTGAMDQWSSSEIAAQIGFSVLAVSFLTVGTLIARRQPDNVIGRLLLFAGWSWAMAFALYAISDLLAEQGSLDAAGAVEAVTNAFATLWVPAIAGTMLLFPDGRLPSARWRWLVAAIWACAAFGIIAPLTNGGWGGDVANVVRPNPIRDDVAPLGDIASGIFTILMAVSLGGSGTAVVVRFRRSRGEERLQLKWLAFAAAVGIGFTVLLLVVSEGAAAESAFLLLAGSLVVVLIPVSVGIAVLKYRLYNIDFVIKRTATYAVVVVLLAAVYVGGILVLGNLLPVEGDLAVVISTLAVFALFNPLRLRVQSVVDRRFSRLPYDPDRVTAELMQRLRDEPSPSAVSAAWLDMVDRTMRPTTSSLWTRG